MVRNTVEVKQLNKEKIIEAVQSRESCTKAEIARETGLSVATCGTILNEMSESGELVRMDQEDAVIGRPATLFAYNRDYRHVLAMRVEEDRNGSAIRCAVADSLGYITRDEVTCPNSISYEEIETLIGTYLKEDPNIRAIGIGIPGVAQDGVIEYCDIKALENFDIGSKIKEKYPVEVIVGNDINFITYQLYNLLEDKSGNLAAIYFPSSGNGYVGSGYILGGRILNGDSMLSGEVHYAAKGFGVTKEKQKSVMKTQASRCKFAAQILLTIICTINPASAVLMGDGIEEADLPLIEKECLEIISSKHIPKLSVNNNIEENYVRGVVRYTLDSMQYRVSMTSK